MGDTTMKLYSVNFAGRIRNFPLSKNNALVPLFEAVVNSLQAIEDKGTGEEPGKITISINRLDVLDDSSGVLPKGEINGFTIEDNGIGFNATNFESFLQSDSQLKEARGGKGVGRFCWLKAFDDVTVDSVFKDEEDGKYYRRGFVFNATSVGIEDRVTDTESTESGSTVVLRHAKAEYRPFMQGEAKDIAESIMRHCLVYLLAKGCPTITVVDNDEQACVNGLLKELLESTSEEEALHINGLKFRLLHIRMKADSSAPKRSQPTSKLYLCANNRCVEEENLRSVLNGLDTWLINQHGFVYVGVLTGDYLDENVDTNRLSFTFPADGENLLFDTSKAQILSSAHAAIQRFLGDYINEAKSTQRGRVEEYVRTTAPQYRHLFEYAPEDIDAIKFGADEEAIDDALHKAKRKLDKAVKADHDELLRKLENQNVSTEDYEEEFRRQVQRASDANKAALADYVVHRRVILDLLEHGLERMDSGKYEQEKYLHELIYPMRSSSDDTAYGAHNLWLIDERLTYSTYITSDLPFGGDHHEGRPDIMCLDAPVVMSTEGEHGHTYDSVIIFELKRPMRDDYSGGENPIDQLLGYAEKIKSGKAKDAKGRYIKIDDRTRMYLYAVCDITPTLERVLKNMNFTRTSDGEGMYMFNTNYNAYIEVLPFDKILRDSIMRNKVFFRTLGIE